MDSELSNVSAELLTEEGELQRRTNLDVRCFPSNYPLTWGELKLLVLAGFIGFFTVAVSALSGRVSFTWAVLVFGLSLAGLIMFVAQMVRKDGKRQYDKAVSEGRWQEGIFVFVTGDVVVRFNRPGFNVDQEFPPGSISSIECGRENRVLHIFWTDALGTKQTFNIDSARLEEKPAFIAAEISRMLELGGETSV